MFHCLSSLPTIYFVNSSTRLMSTDNRRTLQWERVQPTSGSQHSGQTHLPSYAAIEHSPYRHVELLEEGVELAVELDTDLRDRGSGETLEHRARLIDGKASSVRGVHVDGRAQRRVQHDRRVMAVHLLRDGVVAHQVGRARRGIARQTHQGRQIRSPVDEESQRGG